jgi:molybdopterin-guanine dinucleotide biosynthesis protein A
MEQPIGVVLAGGSGRRFGRPKGGVSLGGISLAARAAQALAPLCRGVVVSIGPGATNPAPGYLPIEDPAPGGRGPLAGIAAAFAATSRSDLLVLACDYPAIATDVLRALLAAAAREDEAVILCDALRRDHPLVGLWRRVLAPRVGEAVASGRHGVQALLAGCAVRRLGPAELVTLDLAARLVNVNEPADLERAGVR